MSITYETVRRLVEPEESAGADRVRDHTDPAVQHRIDHAREERVAEAIRNGPEHLDRAIERLDRTSDVERVLEANAAALSLVGLLLSVRVSRWFLVVPAIVAAFLLQHAIQGWCPPLAVIRRWGVPTRRELDAEKAALKALRGDFDSVTGQSDLVDRSRLPRH